MTEARRNETARREITECAARRNKVCQEPGRGKVYRFCAELRHADSEKNDSPRGGFRDGWRVKRGWEGGSERFIRRMHGHKSRRSVSTAIPLHPFGSCVK